MKTRRFDLLVFDWDGTLADSTTIIAEALQRACRDMGCAVPADVDARYVIGLGLADALRHVAPHLAVEHHPRLSSYYREHYLAREPEIPLFRGARELLAEMRARGHRLAIATGKNRQGLDRTLARHDLAGAFDATRCADEGRPKPHPDMLDHLLDHFGTARRRALMIGDTTHDLEMAESAGVSSVAMTHGAHEADRFAATRTIARFDDLAQLRAWLESTDSAGG